MPAPAIVVIASDPDLDGASSLRVGSQTFRRGNGPAFYVLSIVL